MEQNDLLRVWETAQANARHFNDIIIRIRTGATIGMAAALGSSFLEEKLGAAVLGGVLLALCVVLFCLFTLDRMYYHVLLVATVQWARSVESRIFHEHQMKGLAEYVGEAYSHVAWWGGKNAGDKVSTFYGLPILFAGLASAYFLDRATDRHALFILAAILGALLLAGAIFLAERHAKKAEAESPLKADL